MLKTKGNPGNTERGVQVVEQKEVGRAKRTESGLAGKGVRLVNVAVGSGDDALERLLVDDEALTARSAFERTRSEDQTGAVESRKQSAFLRIVVQVEAIFTLEARQRIALHEMRFAKGDARQTSGLVRT